MKQPDLYERMKEVKLLVDEKRVNNVELLQQELDLLHKGLKEEAAKGSSRRRTRGGPSMEAEAAAALSEGAAAREEASVVAAAASPAAPPKAIGVAEDVDDQEGRGGEDGSAGSGGVSGGGPASQVGKLVEDETQAAAIPKAALQRGGRTKARTDRGPAEAG